MNKFNKNSLNQFLKALNGNVYLKRLNINSCNLDDSFDFNLINIPNLIMMDFGMYKASNDMGVENNKFTNESIPNIINFINRHPHLQYMDLYGSLINDPILFTIKDDLSIRSTFKTKSTFDNDYNTYDNLLK
jgi:hypothetical protein